MHLNLCIYIFLKTTRVKPNFLLTISRTENYTDLCVVPVHTEKDDRFECGICRHPHTGKHMRVPALNNTFNQCLSKSAI